MAKTRISAGKGVSAPALLLAASLLMAVPGTGLALGAIGNGGSLISEEYTPFTPADVDPQLALRVARDIDIKKMRFTPASGQAGNDRTVTVAVRVNDETARAISVRSAIETTQAAPGTRKPAIAPTRYNLSMSRGYRSFASAPTARATQLPAGVRKLDMPDLAEFQSKFDRGEGTDDKPSRFQPRIALETERGEVGRTPRTRDALGEQSVDVGGAYRVSRNINVTAGVRISQERDRLDPLTDDVQDSQAVYVGTQFKF